MKIDELRELNIEDLATQRRDLKEEMLHLHFQQQSGQLENTARITFVRRTLARIESILSERHQAESAPAPTNS